jgi:hypothetical protein
MPRSNKALWENRIASRWPKNSMKGAQLPTVQPKTHDGHLHQSVHNSVEAGSLGVEGDKGGIGET